MSTGSIVKDVCIVQGPAEDNELHEWIIKIGPNFMTHYGLFYPVLKIPDYKFTSGILQQNGHPYNLPCSMGGSIDRSKKKLTVHFFSPLQFQSKMIIVRSLKVSLMEGGKSFRSLYYSPNCKAPFGLDTDPKSNGGVGGGKCVIFTRHIPLNEIWKEGVDSIKITLTVGIESAIYLSLTESKVVAVDGAEKDFSFSNTALLREFRDSKFLSDITICCKGKEFPAHKLVLSMASPVFCKMFECGLKELKENLVTIDEVDHTTMEILLYCIYGGILKPQNVSEVSQLVELYKAAHLYCIDELRKWCEKNICVKIEAANSLELCAFGDIYDEKRIKDTALEIIKLKKLEIFGDAETFKELIAKYPKLVQELLLLH